MALVKTDNTIISISGGFGGVYFKRDSSGQHIQPMPRHVHNTFGGLNPVWLQSLGGNRDAYINAWSSMTGFWQLIIALGFMVGWTLFGKQNAVWVPEQPKRRLPGYQWHMHFNVPRAVRKKTPWAMPPNTKDDLPDAVSPSGYPPLNYMNWYVIGEYHGKKLYKSQDGKWYNWWFDPSWIISNAPGQSEYPPYWFRLDESEYGEYIPVEPVYETVWYDS